MQQAIELIKKYYQAFNDGDMDTFLSLLTEDVVHDINQGGREQGKAAFGEFMKKMNHHYKEQLVDMVVMANEDGSRGAAEFVVLGEYLNTDEGLPEANGQTYRLPAGAFFEIRDGKVARITNYYNLGDWIAQVDPQA
ncbi:ketosteroid isomerase-related protein [Methylomonas sp. HW2-6]|uniref:ketosteroid isomerase-related protein n=1 Tax=Methylomonas sp. HW2-6 TaxID=3376687 RepID=UPI0040410AFB